MVMVMVMVMMMVVYGCICVYCHDGAAGADCGSSMHPCQDTFKDRLRVSQLERLTYSVVRLVVMMRHFYSRLTFFTHIHYLMI